MGSRIDIVLTLIRIGFFFGDHEMITQNLQQAEEYVSCFVTVIYSMFNIFSGWSRRAETGIGETD